MLYYEHGKHNYSHHTHQILFFLSIVFIKKWNDCVRVEEDSKKKMIKKWRTLHVNIKALTENWKKFKTSLQPCNFFNSKKKILWSWRGSSIWNEGEIKDSSSWLLRIIIFVLFYWFFFVWLSQNSKAKQKKNFIFYKFYLLKIYFMCLK